MPSVSVIVPNYNHARFLRRRIDTILAQTFQDFELIILDDCSTDESRSILSSYFGEPRVRFEFNEINSGSTFKQWNKGVRLARGQYVWVAESDDYADVRLLERLVAVLEADPRVAFVYCRSWRVTESDEQDGFADFYLTHLDASRWTIDYSADGHEECRNYFAYTNPVPNASAVVFRKKVYERVGGADEGLRLCGDFKLWAAMALGGKVAYLSEPLNYFRVHESSVRTKSESARLDVAERLQVIRWILEQVTPQASVLERIRQSQATGWVPAVMSLRVPLRLKLTMLASVAAIDPHPIRRAMPLALLTIRLKLLRYWRSIRSLVTAART